MFSMRNFYNASTSMLPKLSSGARLCAYTLLALCLPALAAPLWAQTAKPDSAREPADLRLDRKFQRRAVVPLFVNFGNLDATAVGLLARDGTPEKVDAHEIPTLVIESNFQREDYLEEGQLSGIGNAYNTVQNLRNRLAGITGGTTKDTAEVPIVTNDSILAARYNALLMEKRIGNELIARWFDRNENGAFTVFGTFQERARYDADYATKLQALSTVRGLASLTDHADQLVNETYLLVVDIATVQTMEEVYNAQQAKSRPDRGFAASGKVHVFKLDFSDSIQSIFWNDLWIDASESPSAANEARRQAFDEMRFPFTYVQSFPISGKGTQSKNPPESKLLRMAWQRASDAELYAKCIRSISSGIAGEFVDVNSGIGILASDRNAGTVTPLTFDVTGNIIATSPMIAARIGTKEGLKRNRTYFIMEDKQTGGGVQYSKRVGAVRVHTVADNKAEMSSDSSLFYQIAGNEPYLGMFLREKKEIGFALSVGWEQGLRGGMNGVAVRGEYTLPLTDAPYPGLLGAYAGVTFDMISANRPAFDTTRTFVGEGGVFAYAVERGNNTENYVRWGFGAVYEQYFARRFHYIAHLGYSNEGAIVASGLPYTLRLAQDQADIGIRGGISVHHSIQFQAGLQARIAVGAPRLVWSNSDDDDGSVTYKIDARYGDIFPNRGAAVSATFGLRVLL